MVNGIVWLADENIAIHTNADSYIEWSILSTGTYEDEISKLIHISLQPGDNALDIGANIGLQSIRMAKCIGDNGAVYSFEPLDYLRDKFEQNIALNRVTNVTLFPYALSNSESEADFNINKNNWNQGTFSIGNKHQGTEVQHVVIKVADEITEIKTLQKLDLIKIDVEGFEFQVLQGLKETLARHKPRIIFEYDSNYWLANKQDIKECFDFLSALHYTIYQITQVGCELISQPEAIASGNLFCIQQTKK
jgi:FkbM family methyltransferase